MPVTDYSTTAGSNTAISGINIAEGCAPGNLNDAIRQILADIATWRTVSGSLFTGGGTIDGNVVFTGNLSGPGFNSLFASPPAIGSTAAASGSFTSLSASGNATVAGSLTVSTGSTLNGRVGINKGPGAGIQLDIAGNSNAVGSFDGVIRALSANQTVATTYSWDGLSLSGGNYVFGIAGVEVGRFSATGWTFGQPVTVSGTATANGAELGWRDVVANPQAGTYLLAASDRGRCVIAGNTVTVPSGIFAAGATVSIYNNTAGNITIAQGASLTLRQVATANTGNRTLAQRGLATVFFISGSEAVISGAGLT